MNNNVRIIAVSDSHGDRMALKRVIEAAKDSGDIFIHLGDGEREVEVMRSLYPDIDLRHVAGNCDYGSVSPDFDIIYAGGVKVFACHGHRLSIKYGRDNLLMAARDNGCAAALFGHTHCRFEGYEYGIHLLNPGSCSCPRDGNKPSYGFLDITPNGIATGIVELGH